jgi:Fe2+ or Zn2+ uptake regulation protein
MITAARGAGGDRPAFHGAAGGGVPLPAEHGGAPDGGRCVHAGAPEIPDISLATVYKSLETLVGCGLAVKLTYGDGSARYDGRTDPHPHARCLTCGAVLDVPGRLDGARAGAAGHR